MPGSHFPLERLSPNAVLLRLWTCNFYYSSYFFNLGDTVKNALVIICEQNTVD
jgi:hypothetical protein